VRFAVLFIGLCGVASAALLARFGLDAGLSAPALTAWRLTIASIGLLTYAVIRRPTARLDRKDIGRLAIAGLFLSIHFITWIASLRYTSVAISTLLVSTSPLWTGLVGLFIPSLRPKPMFWAGLSIAAIGTAIIAATRPVSAQAGPAWVGYLLATIGAICVVPYLLLSQGVQRRAGTVTTITWIYSFAAVASLLFLFLRGQFPIPATKEAWLSVLGMTLFAQLIGHGFVNYCLRKFTAAQVSASTLLEPVFAAFLAWIFLQERVPMIQAVGGTILLAGVALSLTGEPEPMPASAD
jgi:drug/metabolite transporter (DMT)-like permease